MRIYYNNIIIIEPVYSYTDKTRTSEYYLQQVPPEVTRYNNSDLNRRRRVIVRPELTQLSEHEPLVVDERVKNEKKENNNNEPVGPPCKT